MSAPAPDRPAPPPRAWFAREQEEEGPVALVGSFASRSEADLAAGMLRANGVEASVVADDAGGTEPQLTFVTGGVRLRVPDGAEARARELLADTTPREARDDAPDDAGRDSTGLGRRGALWSAGRLAAGVLLGVILHQLLKGGGLPLP